MPKRFIPMLAVLVGLGCQAPVLEAQEASDLSSVILSANDVLLGQGQLDRLDEFFTEDYGGEGGRERVGAFIRDLRTSFPDLQVEVEILVQDGDRIAWVRRIRATHQADYDGIPATGAQVSWRSMVVSRIEGGRIAEETSVSDLEGVLRSQ